MQNTTTQPQNFYTKPAMPSATPQAAADPMMSQQSMGSPSMPSQMGKKPRGKQMIAIAGLVLFLIVAVMGVLIAQRQVAKPGEDVTPVAPTAPKSQPEAASFLPNACVTVFSVPSPFAECTTKVALTNFSSSGGKNIPAGTKFNVGDEFVFSITVNQPSAGTVQNVKLIDNLPNSLQFVSGPSSTSYSVTNNGQLVTATIPQIGANSSVKVEFKVKVTGSNFGDSTNTAYVDNTNLEKPDKLCSYDFSIGQGIVECVDKTLYDLNGQLIGNGGALDRGKRYEYRVTAKATNRSLGEVKVLDILPEELKYIGPASGSEKFITYDPKSGVLTANFGVLEDEEATVGFIVEVPDDIEPKEFTNLAKVYAFPPNSTQPEPPANADQCSITHTILPVGTAECVEKQAFTNFGGQEINPRTEIEPGDEFVYKITITAEQTTSGPVTVVDELPRDLSFIQDSGNTDGLAYNSTSREVTIDLGVMQTGQTKVVEFKVQLAADPQDDTFVNVATVFTDGDTKHTCEIPLKVEQPTYACNSACKTNENCATVSDDYICYNTGSGNFCRHENNPTNTSCQVAQVTPTPTPTPTPPPTGPATPTPTPAPGCNELCVQNADCSNTNHICVTTDDGSNRCRLADYPNSNTCTVPGSVAQQPVLPETLPQTGPADWINWLKAGLVTLGIGTALFLLL